VSGRLAKVRASLARRGLWGTLRHAAGRAGDQLRDWTPAARRERRERAQCDRAFDAQFHIDTGGLVTLDRLDVLGANRDHGVCYLASDPDEFARALSAIPVWHENYAFVDYGSGKGRAVLLAARYPFKRVIGVEFARELHEAAVRNRDQFRGDRRCGTIEFIHADVTTFVPPPEPLVCYFYNPFGPPVMRAVIEALERSLAAVPRDVIVCHCNPRTDDLWSGRPAWERVAAGAGYTVFRGRGSAAAG
jgi:predicted RNA methylase